MTFEEFQKFGLEDKGITVEDFEPSNKTDKKRIEELEAQNEFLTECLLEIGNIIYS